MPGRWRRGAGLSIAATALVVAQMAAAHPAAAAGQGDAISDPQDTPNGLDIQQATRATNGTDETLTITDYSSFTDQQTNFFVELDTTGDGIADEWVAIVYDSTSGTVVAGLGPAGSGHLNAVAVSRPTTSSVSATFPLPMIANSTNFDWTVASIVPATSAGASPVVDLAPDSPTVNLPLPIRIAGTDRIDTAVLSSFFYDGSAEAVVLARSDDYPDALGGAPLAAAKDGPLLLTPPASLDSHTLAEIQRVLPQGKTVYLLGGTSALSQSVEDSVKAAGYSTVRYAGPDRYATSLAIVQQGLGDPSTIFLTTGLNFPDALSAGAAAANQTGGILLTAGSQMPSEVASYLQAHPSDQVKAVGGPAAAADPQADATVGADRYDTAAKVAAKFFAQPGAVGIASGLTFPDALAGGATMGEGPGPLLLTDPSSLSAPTQQYLTANKASIQSLAYLFGGTAAVSDAVANQIATALS